MPTTEWMNKYGSVKDKLACKTDLNAYFTEKVIGNMGVDVLNIGTVHFPTGTQQEIRRPLRLRQGGGQSGEARPL